MPDTGKKRGIVLVKRGLYNFQKCNRDQETVQVHAGKILTAKIVNEIGKGCRYQSPWHDGKKLPTLDRKKPYPDYCHGDAPSIAGAQKLADAGFAPVYRLKGNYAAWVAAGYPVQT